MEKKTCKIYFLLYIFIISFSVQLYAQQITISGVIIDKEGNPLPGVSVKVRDSQVGTISNSEGTFILSNVERNARLEISFIGFTTQTLFVNNRKRFTIVLQESEQLLDEIVVVGYGTQRKEDLAGSIAQVDVPEMVNAPVGTFDQAMAGRIAGVSVNTQDGQPGETSSFVIRGGNSLTQSIEPLFVVDGFLMEDFSSAAISSQDIQSISILKDASATAIYGARGANGVVVIQTKKGFVRTKPTIAFSSSVALQKTARVMELMNPYEYVEYQHELHSINANKLYLADVGKTLEDYKDAVAYNFQEKLLRTAPMQRYDLSVRGGNQQTRYSISGSAFQQDGIILNSSYGRYSARLVLDQNIGKKIKTSFIIGVANSRTDGSPIAQGDKNIRASTGYLLAQAWAFTPANVGNKYVDWDNEFFDETAAYTQVRVNPVQNAKNIYNQNLSDDLNLNFQISYAITKNLTLKSSIGRNSRNSERGFFYNSKTLYGTPLNINNEKGSWGGITNIKSNSWLNENTLSYNARLKKHSIDALLGVTVQESKNSSSQLTAEHVADEELGVTGLGSGRPSRNYTGKSANRIFSFLNRINYTYDQKYILTSTLRADGSSKFPPKNKWGYFPSLGLAWRLSEEPFLKSKSFISNLKLRGSYGVVGNNRVPDYLYYSKVITGENYGYSFGDAVPFYGAVITNIANLDLRWEGTEQIDFGLDIGLFKNRLSVEIDVYRKNTRDLLLNAPIPRHTGFLTMMQNIGEIRNQGLEISIKGMPIKMKSFMWYSSFNIAFNKNTVVKFLRNESVMKTTVNWSRSYNNPLYIAEVGGPVALFYGYIHDGNYQYDDFDELEDGKFILKSDRPTNGNERSKIQPGDVRYRDLNGDGTINQSDFTAIGNPTPIHFGGFSNKFTYKDLSLSVLLQWSYGNDVYNANRALFEGNAIGVTNTNQFKSNVKRWRPDNPTNNIPRAGGHGPVGSYDSRTVEDASYIRLKTLALEYRFPKKIRARFKLSNLSLTLSAQNLFTLTKYKGLDPEVSTRNSALTPGFDYASYPRAKTLAFGIKINY